MKRLSTAALMLAMLAGCATYPTDPVQQAQYHIQEIRKELAKGDLEFALLDVVEALKRPTGAAQLQTLMATDPSVRGKLIEAVDARIAAISSGEAARKCEVFLAQLVDANVFDAVTMTALEARYVAAVRAGNESGKMPFVLGPDTMAVKALADGRQQRIVFDRTMTAYRDRSSMVRRDMAAVVAYVRSGSDPSARAAFQNQLPSINVRSSELDQVALVDPGFANRRKAQLSLKAHLLVKNADRLFADDVATKLNAEIRGVTWVPSQEPGALEVVVERVRDAERILPIQFRTVTYSYEQVDVFNAALYMPKHASYQFELRSGGAELEYGYVISAWKNGVRLSENVLRGKLGGAYRKCENARVVNVFGGVSSAGFMANEDMKRACSEQTEVAVDALRTQLLGKISTQVMDIPEVSAVHSMNL